MTLFLLSWAFFAFVVMLIFHIWSKSTKYGWVKGAGICFALMIVFAASMGESYFDSHNALPWFFGLDFTQGPIYAGFFLILILAFWVVRHIFKPIITKLAGWYSANTKLPGQISVFALAVLFLGIYSFLGFHAGANLTKATGMRPAQATVAVLSDATSATLRFFANTLDEDSKFNESKGR